MPDTSYSGKHICQFIMKWEGRCGQPAINGRCEKHRGIRCTNCGKPTANRECPFVDQGKVVKDFSACRKPLCANCTHTPYVPGKVIIPDRNTHVTRDEARLLLKQDPPVEGVWQDKDDINDDDWKTGLR